jgi:hypothetical protein
MNAPITEAHRKLAPRVTYACYGGKFHDDQTDEQQIPEGCLLVAAQLISDSEAKAVHLAAQKEYGGIADLAISLKEERDQLRVRCDQLITSSELTDLAFLEQRARAGKAEAELAKERARLDHIIKRCSDGSFYHAESRNAIDADINESK